MKLLTAIIMAITLWLCGNTVLAGPYFPNIVAGAAGYEEVFVPFNTVPGRIYTIDTADTVRCDVYELDDRGGVDYIGLSGGGSFTLTVYKSVSELLICHGIWKDELVVILVR
jgi:hypothetical protein